MAKKKAEIEQELVEAKEQSELWKARAELAGYGEELAEKVPFVIPEDITDPENKLVYALADLAGFVTRLSERNETGGAGDFHYSFTSVFDMIDQVRPLLHERGLYMSGTMLLDSDQHVRTKFTTSSNREGTDLRLPVEWTIENYYGARHEIIVLGEARDTTDKATGKAFTASQKIALRSFCGLSTGDPEDPEQDHVETSGASAPAPAQGRESGKSYATKITEWLGICPIHDMPFIPPSKKAAEAGHGASHKDGDGWCQYNEIRQGHETEVGPMIKLKLATMENWIAWLKINAQAANLVYIEKNPRKLGDYRPQDWHFIRKALDAMPEKDDKLEPEESSFCEHEVMTPGTDEVLGVCRLLAGHPDYIMHNHAPTLDEIKDAKDAKEDEEGSTDAEHDAG